MQEAQYFTPKFESYELHFTIIQQMPIKIREILSTIDFNSFDKITQALSQLDLTFQDKINNQGNNNRGRGNQINHDNSDDRSGKPKFQSLPPQGRGTETRENFRRNENVNKVTNSQINYRYNEFPSHSTRVSNVLMARVPLPDTSRHEVLIGTLTTLPILTIAII